MSIIGTAGWTIPACNKAQFPDAGSHLARYAQLLTGVEINSSFYRSHKHKTYVRWAAEVSSNFQFSVKIPRTITHVHRLQNYDNLLNQFLAETSGLGKKLGMWLVQLPPSLAFDSQVASAFFFDLARAGTPAACEPRHISWFSPEADTELKKLRVARVAADPPVALQGDKPGGDRSYAYHRLHGSPKIYFSDYASKALKTMASELHEQDWCIFDNTAASHALGNCLTLSRLIQKSRQRD